MVGLVDGEMVGEADGATGQNSCLAGVVASCVHIIIREVFVVQSLNGELDEKNIVQEN